MKELGNKIYSGENLSLDDIRDFENWYSLLESGDEIALNEALQLLDKDIKLRNEKFYVDCIADLYHYDDLLPESLRTKHPKQDDVRDLIKERLRDIVLHEYQRLHRLSGQDFISGKINFEEHIKITRAYATDACKLYPQ